VFDQHLTGARPRQRVTEARCMASRAGVVKSSRSWSKYWSKILVKRLVKMPVEVRVKMRVKMPVEALLSTGQFTVTVPGSEPAFDPGV
jgi:hypothetical protein